MINEDHVKKLDNLMPGIFENNQAYLVIERIIEHIEQLEMHIVQIRNAQIRLYGGKAKEEEYLAFSILRAQQFLDERNSKRQQ